MFYLDLFRTLEQHHVRYLLVGGLALNIHGVERATMDVDLMLDNKRMLAFALRPSQASDPTVDILVQPLKTSTGRQRDEADIQALRQLGKLGLG